MCSIGHADKSFFFFFSRPSVFCKRFLLLNIILSPWKSQWLQNLCIQSAWWLLRPVSLYVLSGVRTDILLGDSVTISWFSISYQVFWNSFTNSSARKLPYVLRCVCGGLNRAGSENVFTALNYPKHDQNMKIQPCRPGISWLRLFSIPDWFLDL